MSVLRAIPGAERCGRLVDALAVDVSCRDCGSPLHEVNAGMADGRCSQWVGACIACHHEWVFRVDVVRVATRDRNGKRFRAEDGRRGLYEQQETRYR